MLKDTLLKLDLYIDNDYLQKYCDIINNNLTTQKQQGVTERHHIIQRQWYRLHNCPVDNSKENIVNLSHFDHCLAHYYLCMCTQGALQYANEYAFIKMVKIKSRFEFDEEKFLQQADQYAKIYSDFCKHQSELNKASMDKRGGYGGSRGKHCYTDGQIIIFADVCPMGFWPTGTNKGCKFSEITKSKMQKAAKQRNENPIYQQKLREGLAKYYKTHGGHSLNKKWINNGNKEMYINSEDPIPDGWSLGRLPIMKDKQRQSRMGRIGITDGIKMRFINPEEPIPNGWHRGSPSKKKEK